jgi:hypothetical protein
VFKLRAARPSSRIFYGKEVVCGPMVIALDRHLGDLCSKDARCGTTPAGDVDLIHLVTTDGHITVEGIDFYDYRAALDKLL